MYLPESATGVLLQVIIAQSEQKHTICVWEEVAAAFSAAMIQSQTSTIHWGPLGLWIRPLLETWPLWSLWGEEGGGGMDGGDNSDGRMEGGQEEKIKEGLIVA